ncbi:MAG: succinate dehydrogenase [Gemmatimonadota bacterium]
MMTQRELPMMERRGFGQTMRQDTWWLPNIFVVTILTGFITYATWAAFQNQHYTWGPYLSPFYSPEIFGGSEHSWFGPRPGWWPSWLPFSPALIILPFPALFRVTCYYYRGAYYKAFWADPPSCAVGEPRKSYLGERYLPLVLQNVHRYFLLLAVLFLGILAWDAWKAFWWPGAGGQQVFGVGLGTLILVVNLILLGGYTLGCHSLRHMVGGAVDQLSRAPVRRFAYRCSSICNRAHMRWAWASLFSVAFSDIYIRLCAMGIWADARLI